TPFGVTFNSNPVLTAQAGKQGVYLNIAGTSGVLLGQVTSGNGSTGYGPVSVIATGSLNPLNSATVVQGNTITLVSTNGGIGNTSPLTIKPMISGAAGSGTVNIEALGNISIVSNGTNLTTGNPGDLLIGSKPGIVSQTGNVTVNVPNGAVLDAGNETAGGALSTSQLQTIWGNLHLETDNKQVDGQSQQYWQLVDNGVYTAGTFTLNTAALPTFASAAAASLNVAPATVTDDQIQAYANNLYQSLTTSFVSTFGSNWQARPEFVTHQVNFQFNDAQQNATAMFEKQTDSQYRQYWLLLANGSASGGTFSLNSPSLPNFSSLAAAYLNLNPTTITNAQIQTYANDLYQGLISAFLSTFGSNWQTQSQFVTFQTNFMYTATVQQSAALGGQAGWSAGQLLDAVNEAALQGGTPVGNGIANIVGRNVTVTSGGSLGTLLPPLQINITDLVHGTLTDQEAAALAVATTPGQVTEHNVTYTTEYVQADGSFGTTACTGCIAVQVATGGTLVVQQEAPLFVSALGTFNGSSNGTIYLQAANSPDSQNSSTDLVL